MDERFDGFAEGITNWEVARSTIDLDLDVEEDVAEAEIPDHALNPRIHLFSRNDVNLYGTMPKIEQRIYTKCKDCSMIFSPQDILSHKICTEAAIPKSRQYSGRKTKTRSGNGRKPPPAFVPNETEVVDPSSFRSKKPRRNATRTPTKEFDPDVHCGVVEGVKGPCTRSITCSNHRIQLKKLVPGRSKEVQQLIAERRLAKDLKVVVIPTEVEESETTVSPQEEEVQVKIELPVRLIEPMSPVPQTEPAYSPAAVVDVPSDKVIVSIPDHFDTDLPMYKSHPKPVAFPPFAVRRYGGASLFSGFHFQTQRNDVLKAINDNSRVDDCDAFGFVMRRRSDRKLAGHVVLQYDTATEVMNGGDGMQENIGFKEVS